LQVTYRSKSFTITPMSTACVIKYLLDIHCRPKYGTLMPYSMSSIGVTLKSGLGVVQGHWRRRRSINHIQLCIGLPLYVTIITCTIFELFDAQDIMTLKSTLGSLNVIATGTILRFSNVSSIRALLSMPNNAIFCMHRISPIQSAYRKFHSSSIQQKQYSSRSTTTSLWPLIAVILSTWHRHSRSSTIISF